MHTTLTRCEHRFTRYRGLKGHMLLHKARELEAESLADIAPSEIPPPAPSMILFEILAEPQEDDPMDAEEPGKSDRGKRSEHGEH